MSRFAEVYLSNFISKGRLFMRLAFFSAQVLDLKSLYVSTLHNLFFSIFERKNFLTLVSSILKFLITPHLLLCSLSLLSWLLLCLLIYMSNYIPYVPFYSQANCSNIQSIHVCIHIYSHISIHLPSLLYKNILYYFRPKPNSSTSKALE